MTTVLFTVVRDPGYYLDIFLRYYSKQFEHIIIIDNLTQDGTIEEAQQKYKFKLETWDHKPFGDYQAHTELVKKRQAELLEFFDIVVYADVDEIIYPIICELRQYIEMMKGCFVRCKGYEMVDIFRVPYDVEKSVFEQRKFWFYSKLYSKTLITKHPLDYTNGQHTQLNVFLPEAEDLLLIHLHRLDFQWCLERNERQWWHSIRNAEYKPEEQWTGWQNKVTDPVKFFNFYYRFPENYQLENIPENILNENRL